MSNRKASRYLVNFLLVLALVLPASFAQAAPAPQAPPGDGTFAPYVQHKIHDDLLADIRQALTGAAVDAPRIAGPAASLSFVARTRPGTDLSAYAERWFARPFVDPLGMTVASGYARPTALLKMAALDGVIFLQRAESLAEPPPPVDADVAAAQSIQTTRQLGPDAPAPGPAPEGWYHTTPALHGSQAAWTKGYTGAGVRYMSNDSGADYCHPDLIGTWAYITDEGSPYYGLPEMFDSYSSYLAAYDFYLGASLVAEGNADYADTSATADGDFSFAPIGAAAAHQYTVPGTSLSGTYHYGSHPDKALAFSAAILSAEFGDGAAVEGERAAVLVVDEETAGVYDTVYVDLNYNFDFSDDTPARLTRDFANQEIACLDYDADGLNDISGGLVYFIADGATAVPTLDWYWGVPGDTYGNGDLVAFHVQDFLEPGGSHGQGTTSVAVGQGIVHGSIYVGPDGYPIADNRGLVVGPGKDVASTQNGNFYVSPFIEDAYVYAALGYDATPGTGDDIQIVSNSWGDGGIDNDGFDLESRLIDAINRDLAPTMALLFSTGNGAPGYGTSAPPSPPSGIGVGASTLFGSIGLFEPIALDDQIVGGDVMSWSNRGPGARNVDGVDVVATGAFGTGDLPLNEVLWGAIATADFGGTSMSAPVAAGNLALIYQAWRERTGTWPTFEEARTLLMSTAQNIDHDVWSQGAGLVDADTGTEVAAGRQGIYVSPAQWSVGDYRGADYDAFAHIIQPGGTDQQEFTLHNPGLKGVNVAVRATRLQRIGKDDYSFTSEHQSQDHGAFTVPDYVFRIDQAIPRATDLLMVRVTKPYEQFDPNEDLFEPFNNWRVHLQNWTDLDLDGEYWVDSDGNGKVSATLDEAGNVIESEMDEGEYIRFTYGYNAGPTQQARIANPLARMADGILLSFRHRDQAEAVPQTDLTVEVSYWTTVNWPWLTMPSSTQVPPGETVSLPVTIDVPSYTPYGMYEGALILGYDDEEVVVPVTVAVAATGTSFTYGIPRLLGVGRSTAEQADEVQVMDGEEAARAFGGDGSAASNFLIDLFLKLDLYDNWRLFGYTDYTWREESGDWRFFWTDIAAADLPASGQPYLVVDNAWRYAGSDIDTLIMGPTPDCFSNGVACPALYDGYPGNPALYGPYTLEEVGGSNNTYIGSGRWLFETSSGRQRELVAAPAQEGLHGIFLHHVRVDGEALNEPFSGLTGLVTLDPGTISVTVPAGAGSAEVSISSELDLRGFMAEGFGLSTPQTSEETVNQDNPNDPATASFVTTVEIDHGALLEVSTCCTGGSDIDLYLFGPDGTLRQASTSPTDEEFVSILFPEDGTYTIAVHGWSVPSDVDTFLLTINAVQGEDVSVTDLPRTIPAGGSETFTVSWDTTGAAPGTYQGLVLLGPWIAPGLLSIPLEITVEGTEEAETDTEEATGQETTEQEPTEQETTEEGVTGLEAQQPAAQSEIYLPYVND